MFRPTYVFNDITEIKPAFLRKKHIRGLILDLEVDGEVVGKVIFDYSTEEQLNGVKTKVIVLYIIIGVFEGSYLYLPIYVAMVLSFVTGIGGVTSYTIRISSTQGYVPDEKKGGSGGR